MSFGRRLTPIFPTDLQFYVVIGGQLSVERVWWKAGARRDGVGGGGPGAAGGDRPHRQHGGSPVRRQDRVRAQVGTRGGAQPAGPYLPD